jgi:uncharacterized protein
MELESFDKPSAGVKPYRVLSLDGGGMRGLYTASVLDELSNRFAGGSNCQLDIGKGFDMIVGTSTGGILACALVAGIPTKQVIRLYRGQGPHIFKSPIPTQKKRQLFSWALKNINRAANSSGSLKKALDGVFGNRTIESVYNDRKIGLCVTAVNMSNHESRVFKTPHNPKKHADNGRKLVDVCLATSAAPIVFPIATLNDPEDYSNTEAFVDGGLWANNPILVALIEAIEMSSPKQPIEILSIGTCLPPAGQSILESNSNKGLFYWKVGVTALELSMDAQAAGYNYMAMFLCKSFSQLGKDITVLRFPQTSPSSEQALHLGLDSSTKEACNILTNLGHADGKRVHGMTTRSEKDMKLVEEIFKSLPVLTND